MNFTRGLAALCGLLFLPGLALAEPGFPGEWDLEGRYSTWSPTDVALRVTRLPDGGTVVSRTGKFTSQRFSHMPEFTWSSADVRIEGRRMQVTYRLGADEADVRGLINGLDPDSAERDDVLAALQQGNVLRAVYFLSADGDSIREFVVNNTRQRPEHWWSWVQSRGDRVVTAAPAALSAAEFEEAAEATMRGWYTDWVEEHYASELADTSLTADERRELEEDRASDLDWSSIDIYRDNDDYFDLDWRYPNDPYQDASGNPIPRDALAVRGLSMFPEFAGIGLSKTWLFDTRTGDVVDEGDVMD